MELQQEQMEMVCWVIPQEQMEKILWTAARADGDDILDCSKIRWIWSFRTAATADRDEARADKEVF